MDDVLPVLPLAQYRARFRVKAPGQFPNYLGSALRGAFGHALKKAVCVTRLARCESCPLYRSCPYSYIFETPPPLTAAKMRLYNGKRLTNLSITHKFFFHTESQSNIR